MKYKGRPDVCVAMGTLLAESVGSVDFFADIDAIVPVPLSRKRLRQRGYNQAEQIAKGIGKATGIRVFPDVLRRKVDNATQTRLNSDMRMVNVHDIFEVVRTNGIKARHILLVDDVVTTGATLLSMARTLAASFPGVRFSVACVGQTVRQLDAERKCFFIVNYQFLHEYCTLNNVALMPIFPLFIFTFLIYYVSLHSKYIWKQ